MNIKGKTATTVRPVKETSSDTSLYNALDFLVENKMRGELNTAEVVRVVAVYAGGAGADSGHVDVLPLVCQTDGWNNVIEPVTIYKLPYSRIQGGVAALVIDPVPGDVGLAVFCKRDSSLVKAGQKDPVQPGSFRSFSKSDGFYIGGFLNRKPEIWLELTQEHVATLHAPAKVVVETREAVINASESCTVNTKQATLNAQLFTVNAPQSVFNGNVAVRDNLSWGKEGTGWNGGRARITRGLDVNEGIRSTDGITNQGGLSNQGGVANTGGVVRSNGITLETHVHSGVDRGSGSTDGPRG